jgi:transcriptional regulator with PAS, ATPase and Fis domain
MRGIPDSCEMPSEENRGLKKPDTSPLSRVTEIEEQLIMEALRRFGNNTEGKRKAAKALGISLATLYRRLDKLKRGR